VDEQFDFIGDWRLAVGDYPTWLPESLKRSCQRICWAIIGKQRFAPSPWELESNLSIQQATECFGAVITKPLSLKRRAARNGEIVGSVHGCRVVAQGTVSEGWIFRGTIVSSDGGSKLQGLVGPEILQPCLTAALSIALAIAAVLRLVVPGAQGNFVWIAPMVLGLSAAFCQLALREMAKDRLKMGATGWENTVTKLKASLRQ
jgi:hypothetical protein